MENLLFNLIIPGIFVVLGFAGGVWIGLGKAQTVEVPVEVEVVKYKEPEEFGRYYYHAKNNIGGLVKLNADINCMIRVEDKIYYTTQDSFHRMLERGFLGDSTEELLNRFSYDIDTMYKTEEEALKIERDHLKKQADELRKKAAQLEAEITLNEMQKEVKEIGLV